jgi:hypothetical protein
VIVPSWKSLHSTATLRLGLLCITNGIFYLCLHLLGLLDEVTFELFLGGNGGGTLFTLFKSRIAFTRPRRFSSGCSSLA